MNETLQERLDNLKQQRRELESKYRREKDDLDARIRLAEKDLVRGLQPSPLEADCRYW